MTQALTITACIDQSDLWTSVWKGFSQKAAKMSFHQIANEHQNKHLFTVRLVALCKWDPAKNVLADTYT